MKPVSAQSLAAHAGFEATGHAARGFSSHWALRRCRRVIYFNFAGTLFVDTLGVALAAMGILTPLPASMVHVSLRDGVYP